jgi:catechol 2,3-dioxygenase-like lactoylglutathione lyase family enzyme
MNTPPEPAIVTTTTALHVSLNVSDLGRALAFYRVLLNQPPARELPDYAKFEVSAPPLVLSLIPGVVVGGGPVNHLGLRVPSANELVEIQHRLEAAGLSTQREEGVACCHSQQTKFWITDPDGTVWEIYILHDETPQESVGGCRTADQHRPTGFARSIDRERVVWTHDISRPLPGTLPRPNNSVHEILLEGSVNLPPVSTLWPGFLREAHRALRPGGLIRVHGLAADKPWTGPAPPLPGPASVVRHLPTVSEVLCALRNGGLSDARIEKLSPAPCFEVQGVALREFLITASKPGFRPDARTHAAVYLGPMSEVTDDRGTVFPRGRQVLLNTHDWQLLKAGPAASMFQFLDRPTT